MPTKISTENIQSASLTTLEGPKISNVQITNSGGTVLDDTAVALTGGYIKLTGNGFQSGCQIKIGDALATSVTFVSATEVRAQVAAASAGTYDVYLVNPDGSYAIRISGLTYSATPTWVTASTLPEQAVDVAISIQLAATGATTYSLQSGSSLPAGVTLSSGGLISGTVTGIIEQTTYNFTIEAIDAELQDSPRAFSVTVTVAPPKYLYVFGAGNNGVIGLNDVISRSSPVQIGSLGDWSQLSSGFYHTIAVKNDGTLWAWGINNYGQLGLGDRVNRSSPVQVGVATNWKSTSCGRYHSLATKTDDTMYSWGDNSRGQLGLNNNEIGRSSPTQVPGVNWNLVSASGYFSSAIKTAGTLWAWGSNGTGQLGLDDVVYRSSPTQIGTNTDWIKLESFFSGSFGIKTNNTLWSWGNNNGGQLGQNNRINKSSPVQVGTDTNWSEAAGGEGQVMALKTNNTLWALGGFNSEGELGLNDNIRRSSPTQIGTSSNWSIISAGYNEYGALKNDGTLWLWGYNAYGQLGQNDRSNRSSPVQVSGSNWSDVYQGYFITYPIKQV